jgi:endoglucanase
VFDLVDFQLDGEFIRMRALDDLAGCASILATLAALSEQPPPGDVYGVFTRAEEVGLVGARLLAEARILPEDTIVVSLESSRTLPGAEIGSGPVIRVGDAGFTFNADAESVLIRAREVLQVRPGGFRVQRQLMSGGTCEASAFALYGYQTTGIAFPLGNYHNGAPEGRIEAEFIHQEDFIGGVELIIEATLRSAERENTSFRRRLREIPQEFRQRLSH